MGAVSDETQAGPGWGELEAMLPLGTHSFPPPFAAAAVRVARVQIPVGAAGNLHTRPGPFRLLLVSTCLGPVPIPAPSLDHLSHAPHGHALRARTEHPSYRKNNCGLDVQPRSHSSSHGAAALGSGGSIKAFVSSVPLWAVSWAALHPVPSALCACEAVGRG